MHSVLSSIGYGEYLVEAHLGLGLQFGLGCVDANASVSGWPGARFGFELVLTAEPRSGAYMVRCVRVSAKVRGIRCEVQSELPQKLLLPHHLRFDQLYSLGTAGLLKGSRYASG